MRDYEILIVVFTVIAIIVSILIEYIKNDRKPACNIVHKNTPFVMKGHSWVHFNWDLDSNLEKKVPCTLSL